MKIFCKHYKRAVAATLGVLLIFCFVPSMALSLDVYVVYSGKGKKEKDQLIKSLPKDFSVKVYNADLLAIADYSGKQKAIAKLGKAQIVVVLQDTPMKILKGSEVTSDLLVVGSLMKTVKSNKKLLYVVAKGTDLSSLKGKVRTLIVSGERDLEDLRRFRSLEVVIVDRGSLDFFKAVSMIVDIILNS